jgi:adenylate cyclase
MNDEPEAVPTVDPANTEIWRSILMGTDPSLPALRRRFQRIPSDPRCKMCAAPFRGPGRLLTRLMMHGPSTSNPMLCSLCFGQLGRGGPGGAEIEISVLFADIRGSTGIAERTSAGEFRRLVQQFYHRAAKAIHQHDGIVDKFLGDGIMALFIPVVAGDQHAIRAIEAGEAVLRDVMDRELVAGGVRVGVGVHTGEAFVGTVGADERLDFTALGDTVNVAARLGSDAAAGELLVSGVTWAAAGRSDVPERRALTVKGRTEPLEVVVLREATPAAVA